MSQGAEALKPMGKTKRSIKEFFTTKNMSYLAVLSAMSTVLYLFVKFSLPMLFPSFLDFQFSDIPAVIGGFMMGPVAGIIIIAIKNIFKLIFMFNGVSSPVGELADFLIGGAFVVTASIIYRRHRNTKMAIVGLAVGVAAATVVAVLANWLLVIPFYVYLKLDGNWNVLVGMVAPLYKDATVDTFYAFYLTLAVVPFNLIRSSICAVLGFLLYQGLNRVDKKIFGERKKPNPEPIAQDSCAQSGSENEDNR